MCAPFKPLFGNKIPHQKTIKLIILQKKTTLKMDEKLEALRSL
jgi:hypothetical protein